MQGILYNIIMNSDTISLNHAHKQIYPDNIIILYENDCLMSTKYSVHTKMFHYALSLLCVDLYIQSKKYF